MMKTASTAIALLALTNPALAAGCATSSEAAALKTAVIQQELMVAALQCHETKAYNRFVMTYRGELQTSDATLKSFFVRRGGEHGEAGYDTFKTKAANLSALEQARNAGAFCTDAHALFAAAFANQGNLMSFVEAHAGATDIGGICTESRPVLARSDTRPAPGVAQAIDIAQASSAEIGGVPAHNLPAIPYRQREAIAAPPLPAQADVAPPPRLQADVAPASRLQAARQEDDEDDVVLPYRRQELAAAPPARLRAARQEDDEADVAPSYTEDNVSPPPRPRYYDIRQRDYYADRGYTPADRGYAPRAYGPPPGWRRDWRDYPPAPPPPRYGWYPRGW